MMGKTDPHGSEVRRVLLLPGDGIGPEVVGAAQKVLQAAVDCTDRALEFEEGLIGGVALERTGDPLPAETRAALERVDAVLLGAVGSPRWDNAPTDRRPETGLLELRATLGTFANLRPVRTYRPLLVASSLKPQVVDGVDIVVVRELTSDLYFGKPKERRGEPPDRSAVDTMYYHESEVRRIAEVAFRLARERRKHVTSVDKANVLCASQLWREVVTEVAREFPDVTLRHMLVDTAAMQLVRDPRQFDVLLTANMFGDILSDEAAILTGSIGMLPSASLGGKVGLYEPVHGSAPDLAGKDQANPLGTILSAAMMCRLSLGWPDIAEAIELAVADVLNAGYHTPDLPGSPAFLVGTREITDILIDYLERRLFENPTKRRSNRVPGKRQDLVQREAG
ncbi:MAG: 3-isopropylmalate dehydrogenase [candidate division KSB1 bacterium]|nr:3-isopropylmalate dehydrogenase [candidate division KSB1 bacterium]